MNIPTHTIAALSTPPGRGALAGIRITGDKSHEFFSSIISEKEKFKNESNRKITIYTIIDDNPIPVRADTIRPQNPNEHINSPTHDNPPVGAAPRGRPQNPNEQTNSSTQDNIPVVGANGIRPYVGANDIRPHATTPPQIIDEVTAIKYTAPHSFTGEDMVEIFCHGGPIITGKILDRLFRLGVHPAAKGEFSRRALLNGKMDLLKAESILGLIDSQTEKHHQCASMGYQGDLRKKVERYKQRIIDTLSDIESGIEFGEEDDVARSQLNTKKNLESIIYELEEELARGERVKTFDEGIFVALAGPANAGKSSLFNEILGFDRSIVHDRPGTTRDIVSEKISFEGVTVKLFDCAGIRETQDSVERKGIERTLLAVKDAHFILWVTSADFFIDDDEKKEILENREKILIVINKIDKISPALPVRADTIRPFPYEQKKQFCQTHNLNHIEISVREKTNTDKLFETIGRAVRGITEEISFPEIIINDRHRGIVISVLNELRQSINELDREEVSAHYLRTALNYLAEFSGHITNDEVMNAVFEKFCIGK